ncbi:MAG: YicC/YloC family endoribonuclease [Pseudomonadota bacterium]
MIKSMTGFARAQMSHELGALAVEVRTVNHRYLETSLRLPEELRVLEPELRERVSAALSRGKVDINVKCQRAPSVSAGFDVDTDLVATLHAASAKAQAAWPATLTDLTAADVLRWPGVVTEVAPDDRPLQAAALSLFDTALSDLVEHREREGERLSQMVSERLDGVAREVATLRSRTAQIGAALLARMRERVATMEIPVDDGRIEQEVALLAQKADVAEELDRLDSHIEEGRRALGEPDPVGRRLDFLMQEFNREANTLASKSHDAESTRASVELKVLIEQMREQIQNVE